MFETIRYDRELFDWAWNKNYNLIGIDKKTDVHRFTWQPHGSHSTIVEVPQKSLVIRIRQPKKLNKMKALKSLGFDKSCITVIQKNG